ncbi:MAG: hypothetical protein FWH49_06830 [Clostridiales bacterium]|nr:hypothetical protein [Clostridiales bacterium]
MIGLVFAAGVCVFAGAELFGVFAFSGLLDAEALLGAPALQATIPVTIRATSKSEAITLFILFFFIKTQCKIYYQDNVKFKHTDRG